MERQNFKLSKQDEHLVERVLQAHDAKVNLLEQEQEILAYHKSMKKNLKT